jgi:hypothetical protein
MILQDLTPLNSRQARKTAVRRFKRFLSSENVQLSFIRASLLGGPVRQGVSPADGWPIGHPLGPQHYTSGC